jgi:hypothetical protein
VKIAIQTIRPSTQTIQEYGKILLNRGKPKEKKDILDDFANWLEKNPMSNTDNDQLNNYNREEDNTDYDGHEDDNDDESEDNL